MQPEDENKDNNPESGMRSNGAGNQDNAIQWILSHGVSSENESQPQLQPRLVLGAVAASLIVLVGFVSLFALAHRNGSSQQLATSLTTPNTTSTIPQQTITTTTSSQNSSDSNSSSNSNGSQDSVPSPTVTLDAMPDTISTGGTTTLKWSSTNATSCAASGAWIGPAATSGTWQTDVLLVTSTYSLTCDGPSGQGSASTTVTVIAQPPPPPTPSPTVTLSALPATITPGSSSTLTWSSTNAMACTAAGFWSGAQATSGTSSTGALFVTSSYTLNCGGAGGASSASAVVTVTSPHPAGVPSAPPMGVDPWPEYVDDNNILNQSYYMKAASVMHNVKFPIWNGTQETMQQVGYKYDTIDDVWGGKRTSAGLQPNLVYYPDMLNPNPKVGLISYVHSVGLNIGLYTSVGSVTCFNGPQGQIPGSLGFEAIDGAEFQKWGVDYMKLDWCGSGIQYSKSWTEADLKKWRQDLGPNTVLEMNTGGAGSPWTWATKDNTVNAFRISPSIKDWRQGPKAKNQWSGGTGSVMGILDDNGSYLQLSHAAPGHWSDAGYLHTGVNLTLNESKSEFSMWSMVSSPLIVGVDITKMKPGDIASQVIFNTEVIAVDQDPLVVQAIKKTTINGVEIWVKPLAGNKFAVAFLNTNSSSKSVTVSFSKVGLPAKLSFRDLWQHKDLGTYTGSFKTVSIPSHGIQLVRGS